MNQNERIHEFKIKVFNKSEKLIINTFLIIIIIISGLIFYINVNKISVKSNKIPTVYSSKQEDIKEKVPNIIGKEFKNLEPNTNYKIVKLSEEFSKDVPEGFIISQNPEPGSLVYKSFTISVNVSKGTKEKLLPQISGLTISEASKILTELKLIPVEKRVFDDSLPSNVIIGYDAFDPGQLATFGEKIVILFNV